MKFGIFSAFLLLGACDPLPRDPAGTSARVTQKQSFTVALADPTVRSEPEVAKLVHEIERRTGAHARWLPGSGEALFRQLDDGTMDLVIGRFTADSPWATDVAFGPTLSTSRATDTPLKLRAAMRNGENRWIMTVERASRAISQEAREE